MLDPTLLQNYSFDTYVPPPSRPVWQARPCHYPATCRQDKIILGIIEARKQYSQTWGKDTELSDTKFPCVEPLLNPHNHQTRFPLTAKIVSVRCRSRISSPMLTSLLTGDHLLFYHREFSFTGEFRFKKMPSYSRADGKRLLCCSTCSKFLPCSYMFKKPSRVFCHSL